MTALAPWWGDRLRVLVLDTRVNRTISGLATTLGFRIGRIAHHPAVRLDLAREHPVVAVPTAAAAARRSTRSLPRRGRAGAGLDAAFSLVRLLGTRARPSGAVDDHLVAEPDLVEQPLDRRPVAHVDAAVGRPVVAVGREVGGVVHGLPAREEHRERHRGVVEARHVVARLAEDRERALAGRQLVGAEAHLDGPEHHAVDHPAQRARRLVDAHRPPVGSAGRAAGPAGTMLKSSALVGSRVISLSRVSVRRSTCAGHRDPALGLEALHRLDGRAGVAAGHPGVVPAHLLEPGLHLAHPHAGVAALEQGRARACRRCAAPRSWARSVRADDLQPGALVDDAVGGPAAAPLEGRDAGAGLLVEAVGRRPRSAGRAGAAGSAAPAPASRCRRAHRGEVGRAPTRRARGGDAGGRARRR